MNFRSSLRPTLGVAWKLGLVWVPQLSPGGRNKSREEQVVGKDERYATLIRPGR
jgi:hypothetical protein